MSLPAPATSSQRQITGKRSFTGHHTLLPSSRANASNPEGITSRVTGGIQAGIVAPVSWTFGRGSVIWRIWPAVLLHTCFAALIVYLEIGRHITALAIPNVMLTVLGVVIGFVISYRAMSGYDRYWMGRSAWTDIIRNSRTTARLIWVHVPPKLSAATSLTANEGEAEEDKAKREEEIRKAMEEKKMALDLVEGFTVALKHFLRGEPGIYYEDLYSLVRPLHEHDHHLHQGHLGEEQHVHGYKRPTSLVATSTAIQIEPASPQTSPEMNSNYIPPINSYGTFRRHPSTASLGPSQPLLPAEDPPIGSENRVDSGLIPFAGLLETLNRWFRGKPNQASAPHAHHRVGFTTSSKHRLHPSSKENLPWEILRCLSEWYSVLEMRGTVPGTSLGSLVGGLAGMEDTLTTTEKILSTPLPFVYAVHIRHTVWVYLFFLPFQLVKDFQYYTIPGVFIAAFIYLGFLAAGEEIEQPFGYDENDLELDMYCRDIIHVDIENLKRSVCLNAPALSPPCPAVTTATPLVNPSGMSTNSGLNGDSVGAVEDTAGAVAAQ